MTSRNPVSRRRPAGLAAVLALAVIASACSSSDKKEAKGPACPRIGVLADAAQLVQFTSTGADLSQLVLRADMVNAVGNCEYDDDHVELAVAIQVHAARGSAGGAGTYQTRYFVAIVAPGERILGKKYFPLPIRFKDGEQQAVVRDSIDDIRIAIEDEKAGAAYEVIVGFELTPDQVIYNRVTTGISRNGT